MALCTPALCRSPCPRVTALGIPGAPELLPAAGIACSEVFVWAGVRVLCSPFKATQPAWGFGQQNIFQALAQTPPWPPSQHGDSILYPLERPCQLRERPPGSTGLACWYRVGSTGAALAHAVWAGRWDLSMGWKHQELPANLAALCAAAQGWALACQGRDQLRAACLPDPVCTDAYPRKAEGRGDLQDRQEWECEVQTGLGCQD